MFSHLFISNNEYIYQILANSIFVYPSCQCFSTRFPKMGILSIYSIYCTHSIPYTFNIVPNYRLFF
jgi:hypothetical protein